MRSEIAESYLGLSFGIDLGFGDRPREIVLVHVIPDERLRVGTRKVLDMLNDPLDVLPPGGCQLNEVTSTFPPID